MKGELWAMMLDAKRTFDELIERHAPDEETRDRVLSNRIYQEVSNAMAGSQEYMAMEKLYELYQEDRYDLLVLDTPPTRHALDFIDAPERMTRFIEGKSLQFFLRPGRFGVRMLGRSGGALFSVLKRITGIDLLQDLSEFFQSFGDMAKGFSDRAQRVNELLVAPRDDLRAGDRARARADRRGDLLLAQARRGEASVRRRRRQQGPSRLPAAGRGRRGRPTAERPLDRLAVELERSLDGSREQRRAGGEGARELRALPRARRARPREHRRA